MWRIWGRVGACLSLVAYLVEYAPPGFGLRLEVNNPLYALAWLGGAELIALAGERRAYNSRISIARLVLSVIAVAAPLVTIVIFGSRVFVPVDRRMSIVHSTIGEFHSLPGLIAALGGGIAWRFVVGFALLVPIGLVARRAERDRILIVFAAA